jgi:hypothetical protein
VVKVTNVTHFYHNDGDRAFLRKHWYAHTRLHDVIKQKTTREYTVLTAARTVALSHEFYETSEGCCAAHEQSPNGRTDTLPLQMTTRHLRIILCLRKREQAVIPRLNNHFRPTINTVHVTMAIQDYWQSKVFLKKRGSMGRVLWGYGYVSRTSWGSSNGGSAELYQLHKGKKVKLYM